MQDAATRAQVSSIVHGQVVEVRQAREARGLAPEWPTPALHQRLQRDALSPEPCASPPNLVERLCSLKQQQRQQGRMTCTRAEWPAFSPLVTVPRRMIGSCTCGRSVDLGQLWLSMFGLKEETS